VKGAPRQRDATQVGLDDADERISAEPPPQPPCQRGIELDRDNPGPGPSEWRRQRAEPGAEIEHQISGADPAGTDETGDKRAVSQEVRTGRVPRLRRMRPPRSRPPWHGRP
jgi:hypothetical protein